MENVNSDNKIQAKFNRNLTNHVPINNGQRIHKKDKAGKK